eukprot:2063204-Rhodomonas_salina.1
MALVSTLPAHACATRCPVLTERLMLPAFQLYRELVSQLWACAYRIQHCVRVSCTAMPVLMRAYGGTSNGYRYPPNRSRPWDTGSIPRLLSDMPYGARGCAVLSWRSTDIGMMLWAVLY